MNTYFNSLLTRILTIIDLKYKSETGSDALLLSNIKLPDETTLSYNYENSYLTEFKHSSGIMET